MSEIVTKQHKTHTRAYLIIAVLGVILSAMAIPTLLLPANSESFPGEKGVFALHAIKRLQYSMDVSGKHFLTRMIRLNNLQEFSLDDGEKCETHPAGDGKTFYLTNAYRAEVTAYSFWGIPIKKVIIGCDNEVQ